MDMVKPRSPELSKGALDWLANGRRGSSSETIFTTLTGYEAIDPDEMDHPYDGPDFRRCRLMFEYCPELRSRIAEMASVSDEWRALAANWDALERTMDQEAADWRTQAVKTPITDFRIRQLLQEVATERREELDRMPKRLRKHQAAAH
ncbi:hypothetical protein [Paraburkholderia youngii]|uniref:hypothetical protein n=1 Tax=Paraburkholderia youngii TaxID=2782701 RepID=UPI003D1DE10A